MISYDGADELDSHCMLSSNLGLEDILGMVWFGSGIAVAQRWVRKYFSNLYYNKRQWARKHPTSISLPIPPGAAIIWLNHPSLLCGFFDAWRMPSEIFVACSDLNRSPFSKNESPRIKLVPSSRSLRGSHRHFLNASSCKSQSRKFGWGMELNLENMYTHSQFLPQVKLEGKWF